MDSCAYNSEQRRKYCDELPGATAFIMNKSGLQIPMHIDQVLQDHERDQFIGFSTISILGDEESPLMGSEYLEMHFHKTDSTIYDFVFV